jgi:hypothetical protein
MLDDKDIQAQLGLGNQLAQEFAKDFMVKMKPTVDDPGSRASLLGVVATDLVAEIAVVLEHYDVMSVEEIAKLFTERLVSAIHVKREEWEKEQASRN